MTDLVYFIFPTCNGTCAHCWSADRLMGRFRPISWHEKLMEVLSSMGHKYSEIKISGGEPFLHNDIGSFPELLHRYFGRETPISIYTSGRPFVSFEKGKTGIEQTYFYLTKKISSFDNCSIQLSIDEFHLYSLSKYFGWNSVDEELNTRAFISNFIIACEQIKKENPLFLGPRLKIHCNQGRGLFHKDELFSWFPNEWWQRYTILTEGLIACGRGKVISGATELKENSHISYFLLPGVDFYDHRQTRRGIEYSALIEGNSFFLDDSPNSAVIIEGWWNLINRKAKYERVLINKI